MRLHGVKLHNLFRYGDKNNVVELDQGAAYFLNFPDKPVQWQIDERKIKALEFLQKHIHDEERRLFSLIGMTESDPNRSNGSGKSSVAEGVLYVLYEKVSREYASDPDAKGKSTLSVVFEDNGVYRTEAYGALLLTVDNALWYIRRGRKVSKNTDHSPIFQITCLASLSGEDEGSHSGQRKKFDQETLKQLCRFNYDTMCNSVMFGQNDGGKFMNGGDKEYKQIVLNALQLAVLQDYQKEAVERRKSVSRNVEAIKSQMELIQSDAEVDVGPLQAQLDENEKNLIQFDKDIAEIEVILAGLASDEIREQSKADADLAAAQQALLSKIAEEEEKTKNLREKAKTLESFVLSLEEEQAQLKRQLESLGRSLLECNKVISGFDEKKNEQGLHRVEKAKEMKPQRQAEKKLLAEKLQKNVSRLAVLQSEINSLEASVAHFDEKKKQAEGGVPPTCPECETVVSITHIDGKISEKRYSLEMLRLDKERVGAEKKSVEDAVKEVDTKLSNIDAALAEESQLTTSLQNFNTAQQKKEQAEAEIVRLTARKSEVQGGIGKTNGEIAQIRTLLSTADQTSAEILAPYRKALADCQAISLQLKEQAKQIRQKADGLKKDKQSKEASKSQLLVEVGSLKTRIQTAIENRAQYDELTRKLEKAKEEESRRRIIEELMGVDGIQTQIVQRYLPMLNADIAEYSGLISGNKIRAEIIDNVEKDCFEMRVSGASSSRPYMLSGGEAVKVRLAVDIALSLLCFARSTEVPEFIFLDEVLAPLDSDTKRNVFDLIMSKLHQHFKMIIVISHDPVLQEMIPHTIVVNKVNGISQIEKQWFE